MNHPPLTLSRLSELRDLSDGIAAYAAVTWSDDPEFGIIRKGTLRRFCEEDGTRLGSDTDLRTAFIWISAGIAEVIMPVSRALELMRSGEMALRP